MPLCRNLSRLPLSHQGLVGRGQGLPPDAGTSIADTELPDEAATLQRRRWNHLRRRRTNQVREFAEHCWSNYYLADPVVLDTKSYPSGRMLRALILPLFRGHTRTKWIDCFKTCWVLGEKLSDNPAALTSFSWVYWFLCAIMPKVWIFSAALATCFIGLLTKNSWVQHRLQKYLD